MEINELAKAFAKAQSEMTNAVKDSSNPYFKSKYADLTSVRAVVMPPLSKNGLSVVQLPGTDESGAVYVKTVLMHESGQFLEFDGPHVRPAKQDAQGVGSVITYLRRYNLVSLCGIASEDDDGNEASFKPAPAKKKTQVSPQQQTADRMISALVQLKSKDEIEKWESNPKVKEALEALESSSPEQYKRVQDKIEELKEVL